LILEFVVAYNRQHDYYPERYICPVLGGQQGNLSSRSSCFQLPRAPQLPFGTDIPDLEKGCGFGVGSGNETDWFPGGFVANDKVLNLTNVSQLRDAPPRIRDGACAPSSEASALEFLNRTLLRGILNGSVNNTLANIARFSGTNNNVTIWEMLAIGMARYLNRTGFAKNVTLSWYFPQIDVGGGSINTTTSLVYLGVNTTLVPRPNLPNWTDVQHEFITSNEMVILSFVIPGTGLGHAVAVNDFENRINRNGRYNISFMDPLPGHYTSTEMWPNGTVIVNGTVFGDSAANLVSINTISAR